MAMSFPVPPLNDRKRVKVYELRNNDWFDRGTGFCTGQITDVCTSFALTDNEQETEKEKVMLTCTG